MTPSTVSADSIARIAPPLVGLPTINDRGRYWDPVMAAADELIPVLNGAGRPVLQDLPFKEGNLSTGHQHTGCAVVDGLLAVVVTVEALTA